MLIVKIWIMGDLCQVEQIINILLKDIIISCLEAIKIYMNGGYATWPRMVKFFALILIVIFDL